MAKYSPQEIENREYFSTQLKYYLAKNNKKQIDLHRDLSIPKSTITGYIKGTSLPNAGNIQKIADYFGIGKSKLDLRFKDTLIENLEDETEDISTRLEKMMQELADQKEALMFRGELMDDETKEAVLLAMQQAMRFAEMSMRNKEKKEG